MLVEEEIQEEEEAGREIPESSCDVGSGCFGLVALEEPVGSPSTGTQHRCFASNGRRQRESHHHWSPELSSRTSTRETTSEEKAPLLTFAKILSFVGDVK